MTLCVLQIKVKIFMAKYQETRGPDSAVEKYGWHGNEKGYVVNRYHMLDENTVYFGYNHSQDQTGYWVEYNVYF